MKSHSSAKIWIGVILHDIYLAFPNINKVDL